MNPLTAPGGRSRCKSRCLSPSIWIVKSFKFSTKKCYFTFFQRTACCLVFTVIMIYSWQQREECSDVSLLDLVSTYCHPQLWCLSWVQLTFLHRAPGDLFKWIPSLSFFSVLPPERSTLTSWLHHITSFLWAWNRHNSCPVRRCNFCKRK